MRIYTHTHTKQSCHLRQVLKFACLNSLIAIKQQIKAILLTTRTQMKERERNREGIHHFHKFIYIRVVVDTYICIILLLLFCSSHIRAYVQHYYEIIKQRQAKRSSKKYEQEHKRQSSHCTHAKHILIFECALLLFLFN